MHYLNTDAQIIMFRDMLNSEIYVDKSGSFGNVILTGISYDRKHKKHECIIEKISLID